MVYAFAVNRVTISGDCFDGAEIWSCGFWMGSETADAGDPAGSAADIAGHWNTFFTTASSEISSNYRTLMTKVSQHKAGDGKVDLTKVDFHDHSPATVAPKVGNPFPPQVAIAVTFTGELQRGTGSKGRMYLPGHTGAIGTDAKMGSTTQGNLSTNMKTFIDAVNADPDVPDRVILVSKGTKTVIQPGGDIVYLNPHNKNVTGLRVGDVYDTQRRRRNDLTEVYSTRVLA